MNNSNYAVANLKAQSKDAVVGDILYEKVFKLKNNIIERVLQFYKIVKITDTKTYLSNLFDSTDNLTVSTFDHTYLGQQVRRFWLLKFTDANEWPDENKKIKNEFKNFFQK